MNRVADRKIAVPGNAVLPVLSVLAPILGLMLVFVVAYRGVSAALALLLVFGALALVPALTARPRLVLVGIVAVVVSNAAAVLATHGIPRFELVVLVLGLATVVRGILGGYLNIRWSAVYSAAAIFLAVQALSVLAASDRPAALTAVREIAQTLVLLIVVVALATDARAIRAAMITIITVAALIASLAVLQEVLLGNGASFFGFANVPKVADLGGITARHSGPVEDANFWGRDLVLFLPIALVVALVSAGRAVWLWWLAVGAIAVGIFLTGSRGAMAAAIVGIVVFLALAGGKYRRALRYAPVFLALLLLLPGVGSRLVTLGELGGSAGDATDPSLTGRVSAFEEGMAMVRDHPLTGVGAANFVAAARERHNGFEADQVLAAHNLYLQLAAEGGIGALVAWLCFYGTATFVLLRVALLRGPPLRVERRALIGAAFVAGLVGWAIASVFLHFADLPMLIVVIGLGVSLAQIAEPDLERALARGARHGRMGEVGGPLGNNMLRAWSVVAVFLAAVAVVGLWRPLTYETNRAQVDAIIAPRQALDYAYVYDVATRRVIARTYSALVADRRFLDAVADDLHVARGSFSATVTAPVDSALVSVVVRSEDAEIARRAAAQVVQRGAENVGSLDSLFGLNALPNATVSPSVRLDAANVALALIVASLMAALLHLSLGGTKQRPRRPGGTDVRLARGTR